MQGTKTAANKRHVLIVDDVEMNRAILRGIFENQYDILEADNGETAIELLLEYPETVMVLLDLVMPGMDGFGVLERMRDEPALADIPVIVNTQMDREGAELRALELGADGFISKPYSPAIIKQRADNIIMRDDLKRQAYEERLMNVQMRYKVEHDQLTGIYNSDMFFHKTRSMLDEDPEGTYTLIRWNIERFKVVNDLFGSKMGDRILCCVADKFAELVGDKGVYGRIQADNFAACFPAALLGPSDFITCIDKAFERFQLNYNIISRIGVYEVEDKTVPVDQMCDRANLALQTIRGSYMRRIAYYDKSLRELMLLEQRLVSDMKNALEEEQFVIYLQPVYSVINDEPMSAEALVRWKHPTMGLISPTVFIPLFERNGFIAQLDRYVWKKACAYMHDMDERGLPPLPVSVNVSRMDFYAPTLCDEFVELTERYGLSRDRLRLEVTESAYTENSDLLINVTNRLRDLGFKILMDDFGSGYSSLNMLKDIRVDLLKIDMKFMEGVETSGRAGNVLMSVVRMSKWLDMSIIAEGVETQAQLNFLRNIGCDYVQGYYYSKPLGYEEFVTLIGNERPVLVTDDFDEDVIDKLDFDSVWNMDVKTDLVFNDIVGGMGIYELYDGKLETLRVNSRFSEILGNENSMLFKDVLGRESLIDAPYRGLLFQACTKSCTSGHVERVTLQRYHEDGHLMWLDVRVRYMGRRRGHAVVVLSFEDITDRLLGERLIAEQSAMIEKHHEFLENLYRTVPCGIITLSIDSTIRVQTANPMAYRLFGYLDGGESSERFEGMIADTLVFPDDRSYFQQIVHETLNSSKTHACEIRIVRHDKSIGLIRCRLLCTTSLEGTKVVQMAFLDTTDAIFMDWDTNMSGEAMSEDEYVRQLFSKKSYRNVLFSDTLFIIEVKPGKDKAPTYIYRSEELASKYHLTDTLGNLQVHPDDAGIIESVQQLLTDPEAKEGDELSDKHYRFRTLNNIEEWVWVELVIRVIPEDDLSLRYLLYVKPIDETKKLADEAEHDYLTGLYNRRAGVKYVDQYCRADAALAKQAKDAPDIEDFFIMFDIDDFKYVNDTYGHVAGDELLFDVAHQIEEHFRQSDVVMRLGGDEFAVFAHNVTDRITVMHKVDAILHDVHGLGTKREWTNPVSMSVGVVISNRADKTFQRLYALADKKLYSSKETGKNRCTVFDETAEAGVANVSGAGSAGGR